MCASRQTGYPSQRAGLVVSEEQLQAGQWYRVVISADLKIEEIKYFINGRLVRTQSGAVIDDQFAIISMKQCLYTLALSVCAVFGTLGGNSEAADTKPEKENETRQGPLAGLPSKLGPHIEKIKALADNQWLNLGSPAADPKWGKARGRSWSSNMALAPDVRGAFVFGEGVHAYVKPDGHYMNDLWFYDVNAHRWVCLYPGIEVARPSHALACVKTATGLIIAPQQAPMPTDWPRAPCSR